MKKTKEQIEYEENFKKKVPVVKINPELDKYKYMNLFPESRAQAEEMLKRVKNFPWRKPHD